jgi:hypothetical protein
VIGGAVVAKNQWNKSAQKKTAERQPWSSFRRLFIENPREKPFRLKTQSHTTSDPKQSAQSNVDRQLCRSSPVHQASTD